MGTVEFPTGFFQPSCGSNQILDQTTIYSLIGREEVALVVEELSRFNRADELGAFQGLRQMTKIGNERVFG